MKKSPIQIVLADDDPDDCMLFEEALANTAVPFVLTQFHFGDQLMNWLHENEDQLPNVLFLDLNMPRKSGGQCLMEIKQHDKLKSLPVVIISTSYEKEVVDAMYKNGAQRFIRKANEFQKLKTIIHQALDFIAKQNLEQPSRANFVLTGE